MVEYEKNMSITEQKLYDSGLHDWSHLTHTTSQIFHKVDIIIPIFTDVDIFSNYRASTSQR